MNVLLIGLIICSSFYHIDGIKNKSHCDSNCIYREHFTMTENQCDTHTITICQNRKINDELNKFATKITHTSDRINIKETQPHININTNQYTISDFKWERYFCTEPINMLFIDLFTKCIDIISPLHGGSSFKGLPIKRDLHHQTNKTAVYSESGIQTTYLPYTHLSVISLFLTTIISRIVAI